MSTLYFRQFPSGYYSNRNVLAPPLSRGEDVVVDGDNMLHHEDLTWRARPGFPRWFTVQLANTDAPLQLFGYTEGGTPKIIIDGETTIKRVDSTSTTTTLYTKTGGLVGDKAFMCATNKAVFMAGDGVDGITGFSPKQYIFGDSALKTWGIDRPTVTPTRADQAGTLDAVVGYMYKYVYKDSDNGHISSSSLPSVTTGAKTNQDQVVTVTGTTQTRVDKIDIYRTKDGGSTFYYLATINNPGTATTTTYTDSTTDSNLNTALIAPSRTSNIPLAGWYFTPGPMCWHQERMFVIVYLGSTNDTAVLCSAHEVDGIINGVREECFPPELTFNFRAATAIASSSFGCLVFSSTGEIYLITGQSQDDFLPVKIFDRVPVLNHNNVTQDGDTFYVYTAGKDVVKLSTNTGVEYISTPLSADDLSTFDPATTQVCIHRDGRESFFVMTDGTNKMLVYNLVTGTWCTPWVFDGTTISCNAIVSAQTSAGVYDLLIGSKLSSAGYIWKMDTSATLDDGSVEFVPSVVFGSLMLANPDEKIQLDNIVTESSHTPTVTLLFQEISGSHGGTATTVDEPENLSATSTFKSKKHYFDESNTPLIGRHLQVKLSWPNGDEAVKLYSLGVQFKQFQGRP